MHLIPKFKKTNMALFYRIIAFLLKDMEAEH